MDFAKAVGKVPHRRLLHKVDYYGIRGSIHKWIASWLSERSQKVVLDGQASDPVLVLSGVPQRSVLGSVLFLIFINDLPKSTRSSVRLFADYCVLYININYPIDCRILQDDLDSLAQWETDSEDNSLHSEDNSPPIQKTTRPRLIGQLALTTKGSRDISDNSYVSVCRDAF